MKKYLLYSILPIVLACFFLNASVVSAQENEKAPVLERKLAYPDSTVFIPYSNLCFVSGSQLPDFSGWILESKIEKTTGKSLLVIEMNSSLGYVYTAGSVQLIVEVPDFKKSFRFDIHSDEVKVHLINNYGGYNAEGDSLEGALSLTRVNGQVKVSGEVKIFTIKSFTKQVATFQNALIPCYTLDEFLAVAGEKETEEEAFKDKLAESIVEKMMKDRILMLDETEEIEAEKAKMPPGQDFMLTCSSYELGWGMPCRVMVLIRDNVLKYGVMEKSKEEVAYISFSTGDTTWKDQRVWYNVPFPAASRDSVLALLKGVEGKAVFHHNPRARSGVVDQLYVEYAGWCTSFSIENASNETFDKIAGIINPYLPRHKQLFPRNFPKDRFDKPFYPSFGECAGRENESYTDHEE